MEKRRGLIHDFIKYIDILSGLKNDEDMTNFLTENIFNIKFTFKKCEYKKSEIVFRNGLVLDVDKGLLKLKDKKCKTHIKISNTLQQRLLNEIKDFYKQTKCFTK